MDLGPDILEITNLDKGILLISGRKVNKHNIQ